MNDRIRYQTWFVALVGSLMVTSAGCARLRIGVEVYKGDLTLSPDAKLGEAVGIARGTYSAAVNVQATKPEKHQQGQLAEHIRFVMNAYNGGGELTNDDGIEALWTGYQQLATKADTVRAAASDPDNSPEVARADAERDAVRRRLARALFYFGAVCEDLGRYEGLPEAIKVHYLNPFVSKDKLKEGVSLEESGRWIMFLTDDAVDTNDRTTISRMMQSVTLGHTGSMLMTSWPVHLARDVRYGLEDAYWANINNISVDGWGDTEYVIVKDDIGNWHIKSVAANQDEVVNAVFDGADGVVGVLAAVYGVDASKDPIASSKTPSASEDYVKRQVELSKAADESREAQSAALALQVQLLSALNAPDDPSMRNHIDSAVRAYSSRVGGDQASQPTAKPTK